MVLQSNAIGFYLTSSRKFKGFFSLEMPQRRATFYNRQMPQKTDTSKVIHDSTVIANDKFSTHGGLTFCRELALGTN